jgi:hypothetical protein
MVRGDSLRLGQVLTNLIGNAIKFTEHGSVVVRVASVEETEKSVTMRFDVTDTGVGIKPEAQSRIFDEFMQADGSTTRKHGGSGLGLAISKQLVEMMGGTIHVESSPGAGSTFWFTSRFEKQATQAQPSARSVPIGLLTGVRALIVESSAVNSGILQSHMSNWEMSIRRRRRRSRRPICSLKPPRAAFPTTSRSSTWRSRAWTRSSSRAAYAGAPSSRTCGW